MSKYFCCLHCSVPTLSTNILKNLSLFKLLEIVKGKIELHRALSTFVTTNSRKCSSISVYALKDVENDQKLITLTAKLMAEFCSGPCRMFSCKWQKAISANLSEQFSSPTEGSFKFRQYA
jgi:hypothetical protein